MTKKEPKAKKSKTVGIPMTKQEHAELSELASSTGRTLSGLIRFALSAARSNGIGPFGGNQ